MARTVAQIEASLAIWYAARDSVAVGQSYTIESGQGRQTVTRANLTEINKTIGALEAELAEAQDETGGIIHIQVGD